MNKVNIAAYKKQQHFVVKLNSQEKELYFSKIDTDSAKFSLWNTCKIFYGKKFF